MHDIARIRFFLDENVTVLVMTWNSLGFLRDYVFHEHVVHEVLNLRVQGSIPANGAYNGLYLYKMNRLG